MEKPLFFIMNLFGMLALGEFFLSWWFAIEEAGFVNFTVTVVVTVLYVILSLVQVIYIGIVIDEGEGI